MLYSVGIDSEMIPTALGKLLFILPDNLTGGHIEEWRIRVHCVRFKFESSNI